MTQETKPTQPEDIGGGSGDAQREGWDGITPEEPDFLAGAKACDRFDPTCESCQ